MDNMDKLFDALFASDRYRKGILVTLGNKGFCDTPFGETRLIKSQIIDVSSQAIYNIFVL